MSNQLYGYARVSTKEQNEKRQIIALSDFSVPEKNIYIDKISGKNFERPQYKKLIRKLKKGDVVAMQSIDRLGRNYEEIIEQWRIITKEKLADIVILDMPLLDTRQRERDLTGTFIADLVLQILSYVAQTERENIRRRQAQGIAAALAGGVQFGKPRKEMPDNYQEIVMLWKRKQITLETALAALKIGRTFFFDHLKAEKDLKKLQNVCANIDFNLI